MDYDELLDILYEDNHCIAVNKPTGWPSAHFDGNEQTVDQLVKAYLKEKYKKPGKVFLGVVHRIDKPVSGCLLFARTSKAASRLSQQFRDAAIVKTYWAVIEGSAALPEKLEDWLVHDDDAQRVKIVDAHFPSAKISRMTQLQKAQGRSLRMLELNPHTGRKHQLRVQLASRGCPIYGDRKYGSTHQFGHAIALHARSLTFLHPIRQEPVTLKAELPTIWKGRFAHLLERY